MRILVLHNQVSDDALPDERDVLVQRDAIAQTLRTGGHHVSLLGCTLDLEQLRRKLLADEPEVVFNLVESLGGSDRLMSLVPQLLESMNVPFTGSSSAAILLTGNKQTAKRHMRSCGLPTPDWVESFGINATSIDARDRFIIKPVWEHASVGLDDDGIVSVESIEELQKRIRVCGWSSKRPHFAERYIEGREFNLSLLAVGRSAEQPEALRCPRAQVMPVAEIDFSQFPIGKPRIVGYRAKWDEDSFEYRNTPRRFVEPSEQDLAERLSELALACWECFQLNGYARVDFRVDTAGQPWILEVNANPCLSPDAGFAAALKQASLNPTQALERIIQDAVSCHAPTP